MTTPWPKVNSQQNAINSILDVVGQRQTYLGNSFSYNRSETLASSSEVKSILLRNASSNVGLFVFSRIITSSGYATMKTYLDGTVSSGGTAATPTELRPGFGTTSLGTLTYTPTMSDSGSLVDIIAANTSMGFAGTLIVVDPGHNLLINCVSPGASGGSPVSLDLSISWYQI